VGADVTAGLALIEDRDAQISDCERELRVVGADHEYVPLLMSAPGIAWVLGYTIAAEIGDINRLASPSKLCGYTGLCPHVYQSGESDHRGPLAKNGRRYVRWALFETASHAARSPIYRERYERTAKRLGRQRGKKVAGVDIARKLAEAIWYMLTRHQPFAPAGARNSLAA
jgi:transposase